MKKTNSIRLYGQDAILLPILRRISQTKKATVYDIAQLVTTHPDTYYEFLVDNNISSVNDVLRHDLHYNLPFKPNRNAIEQTIRGMIDSKNPGLAILHEKFVFNPNAKNYTTNPDLLTLLGIDPSTEGYIHSDDPSGKGAKLMHNPQ